MGFASKGGKMAMHFNVKPRIRKWKCRACGLCAKRCNADAIIREEKKYCIDHSKCIGCGACASVCPQHIDIPEVLKEFDELLHTGPTWAELCRQREEAAEKMRAAMR
jgi:uncharacterized Fe-S center protein